MRPATHYPRYSAALSPRSARRRVRHRGDQHLPVPSAALMPICASHPHLNGRPRHHGIAWPLSSSTSVDKCSFDLAPPGRSRGPSSGAILSTSTADESADFDADPEPESDEFSLPCPSCDGSSTVAHLPAPTGTHGSVRPTPCAPHRVPLTHACNRGRSAFCLASSSLSAFYSRSSCIAWRHNLRVPAEVSRRAAE